MTLRTFCIYVGNTSTCHQYRSMVEAASAWPDAWKIEDLGKMQGGFW